MLGARVKAWSQAKAITISWDHALNSGDNHKRAARVLAVKLDWKGVWSGGALPSENGYAFVQASESDFAI